MLRLYNTKSRRVEEVQTREPGKIGIYSCGPTVYDYAHIGNFRTYVFVDLLQRALRWFGLEVTLVMNLTDVDDKTIRGALAEKLSLKEYTDRYKEAFFSDCETLNILRADKTPAATTYIPKMIALIETLVKKGVAYVGADESVYFSIKKFPHYGCLSHLKLDDLQVGATTSSDEYEKDDVSDFVLWKAYNEERDGDIFWESPWGKGRPGWHLECSVMAMDCLGETVDLHTGGVDLIFPHHENEIAQSEAVTGTPFVRHWVHCEHLLVDNRKMSKSLGNFYTLRNLLDHGFTGRQVRYLLVQSHYRVQLNFTFEGLEASKNALDRLDAFQRRVQEFANHAPLVLENDEMVQKDAQTLREQFGESISEDLNTSVALSKLFDLIHYGHQLADKKKLSKSSAKALYQLLLDMDAVLGVLEPLPATSIPKEILEAAKKRTEARADKNWSLADQLRDLIHSRGYEIEDTATGPLLRKR